MVSHRQALPPASQKALFDIPATNNARPRPHGMTSCPALSRNATDPIKGHLLDGATLQRPYDIPVLAPHLCRPERLICFSEAIRMKTPDPLAYVHFYEDGQQIDRFRRTPKEYLQRLSHFAGLIEPEYSVYANMPQAQKIAQTYDNRLLASWAQRQGMNVVANVRLSGKESIPYALAGVPRHATIALSLHGCTKDRENRRHVLAEARIIEEQLAPHNVLIYGSAAYGVTDWFREHDIKVDVYPPDTRTRSLDRKAS